MADISAFSLILKIKVLGICFPEISLKERMKIGGMNSMTAGR